MIKNNEPLSMGEVMNYVEKDGETYKFIKNFTKLSFKEAKEFKKKLEELELMQLKLPQIIKIIDLMPDNKEDLNKIFVGVSLDENETNKILQTIKEFK